MTRWWAYAVLVIALVLGSVSPRQVVSLTTESELVESALPLTSAVRKRTGKHKSTTRRDVTGLSPLAIAARALDLAAPRIAIALRHASAPAPIDAELVPTSARAPPRS